MYKTNGQIVSVTALLCTLNEAENIPLILPVIPEYVDEILIVDGHSTDGTREVAQALCPRARIILQPGIGKGDALKCGIAESNSSIIVTLDADNATNPADIPRFIDPLLNGYDFVKGSRFLKFFPRNKPLHRIIGNWIIIITFNILFIKRHTDLCSGYNAFLKKAAASIQWPQDGYENEPFLNCQAAKRGLRILEVGHQDNGRIKGDVKESSWRQGFKAMKTIIRERLDG